MKKIHVILVLLSFWMISCGDKNPWDVKLPEEKVELKFTDISKDFFDLKNPLIEIQTNYPFFFDPNTEGVVWEKQRRDTMELAVYDSINLVFGKTAYQEELENLFAYYKFHFPKEIIPQIYTYSSGLQNIYEPVLYGRKEGMMFIALDGFLGSKSSLYGRERVFPYMAKSMTPAYLRSAVVQAIGREIIPFNPRQQTFVDLMVDEGKKLILADALLPKSEDYLKIGYTQDEMNWAWANEGDIWNYFVEQNMIFENDKTLKERFLQPAPFSKFLNEIEAESPGRIGAFMGWMICREYLERNQDVTLEQFIMTDTQTIFNESKYKPKAGDRKYVPTKSDSKDEVKQYED
jgi:hypothetical protein